MSALIEKDIEAKICTKLASLGIANTQIIGTWQQEAAGAVKSDAASNARAIIAVSVAPRTYETFTVPHCDVAVAIAFSVRREMAPTGDALAQLAEPVFAKFDYWQRGSTEALEDFDTANFVCAGFRADGGTAPEYNDAAAIWSFSLAFTLRGHVTAQ